MDKAPLDCVIETVSRFMVESLESHVSGPGRSVFQKIEEGGASLGSRRLGAPGSIWKVRCDVLPRCRTRV